MLAGCAVSTKFAASSPPSEKSSAVTVAASFAANTDNGIMENSRMTASGTEKIRFFSVMAVFISLLLYTRFAIAAPPLKQA